MPIPAALAALGPLFAEAGGAAAGAGLSEAAASAAASEGISGLTEALTAATAGGGGGGGGLTGYGLGGNVPSQFSGGMLGKLFGGLVKPITTLPKQIEDWGQSLVDSKRGLMAFNGAIAGTLLEAERRDIMRKMEEGQRVSGTTEFLSEGLSDLKDEIQPIKDAMSNGFNIIAGSVVRIVAFTAAIAKWMPFLGLILAEQERQALKEQENSRFLGFVNDIKGGGLQQFNDPGHLMPPQGP